MNQKTELHNILRVKEETLKDLAFFMDKMTGKSNVVEELMEDIRRLMSDRMAQMNLSRDASYESIVSALSKKIKEHEEEIYSYLGVTRENLDFDKVIKLARTITTEDRGFFLKKENAKAILKKHPPRGVLNYLNYKSVDEMLVSEDILEIFSALRFVETDEWMHETFKVAYGEFKPEDFEEREIELRVLGDQWTEIAKKFVAKKHHNVSHLKEFGVIFLNPINQSSPGSLLRDFALFLHYFHEIAFYSKLFKLHVSSPDFGEKIKSFLRGDIPEKTSVSTGQWLIVQRYLWKEDLNNPILYLPRVNPESLHWYKAEQDLINFGKKNDNISLDFWHQLDFTAGFFLDQKFKDELVSFDLEDNAMTFSSEQRGKGEVVWYHQQEALWNELFRRYVGDEKMEELLINNFDKGYIIL